jgi:hypothetical protein
VPRERIARAELDARLLQEVQLHSTSSSGEKESL